jgi:hypothetical protein
VPDVVPTEKGRDLDSTDGKRDAHLRLERQDGRVVVCADVFDSTVANPNEAHLDSDCESWGNLGAGQITDFLRGYGFDVRVRFG